MERAMTPSFIRLTTHAKERSLRRYGIAPDTLLQLAEKAVLWGYSTTDAPNQKVRRWLIRKARGKKIYVWGGYVFIMNEEFVLITTYRLPDYLLLSLERTKTYIGG